MSTDCTPRYCYADPYEGGKQAVAECYRNLCAVGALPLAITNCLNFGNPQRPEIMAQIVGCLEGMADACRALDFPIVSGNVSLYNESKATGGGSAILPTPAIGGVGLMADHAKMATIGFKAEGEAIVVIGGTPSGADRLWQAKNANDDIGALRSQGVTGALGRQIGQSLWLREIHGLEIGLPPSVDLAAERRNGEFVRALIGADRVTAVHDISDGGVAVALAEMALAGGVGAEVHTLGDATLDAFAEDQGRYIVTFAWNDRESWATVEAEAKAADITVEWVGGTGGSAISWTDDEDRPLASVPLAALREASDSFFRDWMES